MFNRKRKLIVVGLLFLIVFGFSMYQVYALENISQELEEKSETLEVLEEEQINNSAQKSLISEELDEIESEYREVLTELEEIKEELQERQKELEEKEDEIEQLNQDLQAKLETEAEEEALLAQVQLEAEQVQEEGEVVEEIVEESETAVEETGVVGETAQSEPESSEDKSEILSENSVAKSEQSSSNEVETSSSDSKTRTLGTFDVTYYAVGDGLTPNTYTRNGTDVSNTIYSPEGYRIIAVDTNVIPMDSILEVTIDGNTFLAKASDTGSAIIGNKIDLLVGSPSEAIQRGRNTATVRIVE